MGDCLGGGWFANRLASRRKPGTPWRGRVPTRSNATGGRGVEHTPRWKALVCGLEGGGSGELFAPVHLAFVGADGQRVGLR